VLTDGRTGVPDSPWKCYVDPAQSVKCYHNILTDEKVSGRDL
jgi:hypothetical protein